MKVISCEPGSNLEAIRAYDKAHGLEFSLPIIITKTEYLKCARCWKHCPDVNRYQWTDVCGRCNSVLEHLFKEKMSKAISSVYKEMGA